MSALGELAGYCSVHGCLLELHSTGGRTIPPDGSHLTRLIVRRDGEIIAWSAIPDRVEEAAMLVATQLHMRIR